MRYLAAGIAGLIGMAALGALVLPPTAVRAAPPQQSLGGSEGLTEVPPEAVAAIARDLNCPLCQGYNLQDCPLTVCAQMRDLIRQQLAAGQSREEIVAAFVADYGPEVLNTPPPEGFFLTAWLVPGLALVLGAVALVAFLWRQGPRGRTAVGMESMGGGMAGPRAADPSTSDLPVNSPPRDVQGETSPPDVDPAYVRRLEALARDSEG